MEIYPYVCVMNKLCRVACLVFRGECVRRERAIGSTVLVFF